MSGPSSGWRPRTVLAVLFQVLHLSSIFVLLNGLPTLLTQRGLSVSATIGFSGVVFVGNLLGPLTGIVLADRDARRWLLIGAALVGAATGIAYARQTDPTGIVLTAAMFFIFRGRLRRLRAGDPAHGRAASGDGGCRAGRHALRRQ